MIEFTDKNIFSMKKLNLLALLVLTSFCLFMSSCQEDEIEGCIDSSATNYDPEATDSDGSCVYGLVIEDIEIDGVTYSSMSGNIVEDFTLDSATDWMLNGTVTILDGVKLTIDAGTTISSNPNDGEDYLVVATGGDMEAQGDQDAPIVFTSVVEEAGSFGGLIINGNAATNTGGDDISACGTGMYGGSTVNDNSGIYSYIRVEYGGACTSEGTSAAIVFNGVGENTTVNYIQAYRSAGDGVAINGGTVNIRHAVVTNVGDDSFDFINGWRGNGQFWVGVHNDVSVESDAGIESENNLDDVAATLHTKPKISNVTLVGMDDGVTGNQAVRLANGTKGFFYNFIVVNYPLGVLIEGDECIAHYDTGDDLLFKNSVVSTANSPFGILNSATEIVENDFVTDPQSLDNETYNPLLNPDNGYEGSVSDGAYDPTNSGDWFDDGAFKGAVRTLGDWTADWTRMD